MSRNQTLNSTFWYKSKYIKSLKPLEKFLYIYCCTNPVANIAGMYERHLDYFILETGLDKAFILKTLKKFTDDEKILYREDWIAIKNRNEFNSKGNANIIKGILEIYNKSPDFVKAFVSLDKSLESFLVDNVNNNRNRNKNKNRNKDVLNKWNVFVDMINEKEAKRGVKLSIVQSITEARDKSLNMRFAESIFDFDKILKHIENSDFLLGLKPSKDHEHWKVSFDWILNPNNYIKILEGNYDNKVKPKKPASQFKPGTV